MKYIYKKHNTKKVFMLFLMVLVFNLGQLMAQCGTALTLKPKVSYTSISSGNTGYVFATGWPVAKWLYRDNNAGAWTEVNSTLDYYSMVMTAVTPTVRTFKAVLSTVNCSSDTTDGVDVNIEPITYSINTAIKLSASKYTTCTGGSVKLNMMNLSYVPTQWLYRDNGGNWNMFSTATTASVNNILPVSNVKVVRDYRVIVQHAGSSLQDSSDIVSVTVNPVITGNLKSIRPTVTQTSVCGGSVVNVSVDWPFEVGNWLYRDAGNANWQIASFGNLSMIDNATNVSANTVRSYRALLMNTTLCTGDTSEEATVNIKATIRRTLTDITPRMTGTPSLCAGSTQNFQLQGFSTMTWYYRDSTNGNWTSFGTTIPNNALTSSSSITQDINREVRVVINNTSAFCSMDTTATISYLIKANTKGNTTSAIPFVTQGIRCTGAQVQVYMGKDIPLIGWCWSDQNSGIWNFVLGGNTYTDFKTDFAINTTRAYKALVNNSATCSIDSTLDVKVQFQTPQPGGIIPVRPRSIRVSACGGSIVSGNIQLDTGKVVTKWLYKDKGMNVWLELSNQSGSAFSDSNTQVPSNTVRSYIALVKNTETFKLDTSYELTITIKASTYGNIKAYPISNFTTICNNSKLPVAITVPADYSVKYWITRELLNQPWTINTLGASSILDSVSSNNQKRSYRVLLLNDKECKLDTSEEWNISVLQRKGQYLNEVTPNVNLNNVCSGTPLSLSTYSPSGGVLVNWMFRDNGASWKVIASNNVSYNESTANTKVLVPTIRDYRVLFNNTVTCTMDTSNFVTVSIKAYSGGKTTAILPLTANSVNCAGVSISLGMSSITGSVQKWNYRDNNGPWKEFNAVTNASNINDNNTNVTTTTFREYRNIMLRSNSCLVDTSLITGVTIKPYTYGNADGTIPTSNTLSACSGNTFNVSTSGTIAKWIYCLNQTGEWRETENSSNVSIYTDQNTQFQSGQKAYRAILITTGCSYDTTAQVVINLNLRSSGYLNSVSPNISSAFYCSGTTLAATLNGSIPSGSSVKKWLYMDNNNGVWNEIGFTNGNSLTHTNTFVTVPTTRAYRVVLSNTGSCSYDSSGIGFVTINPVKRGSVAYTPTCTPNFVCNYSSPPSLAISSYTGTFVKWIMNTNGNGWVDFPYNTNQSSYTDYTVNLNTPAIRMYKAIISNTSLCSIDSSNSVSLSISPTLFGSLNGIVPKSNAPSVCYGRQVNLTVDVPSNYTITKWIYRNNNGAWQDFSASSASAAINDNNTLVSIPITRSYRALFVNTSNCRMDSSAVLSIQINPRNTVRSVSNLVPTANTYNVCSGTGVALNLAIPAGSELMQWVYNDNGGNGSWLTASNSYNQKTFTHNATQLNTITTRFYKAIVSDTVTCRMDTTQSINVKINPLIYRNNTGFTFSTPDSVCSGSGINIDFNQSIPASPIHWLSSLNNGEWQRLPDSTRIIGYVDYESLYPAGSTKQYKVVCYNPSACSIDTILGTNTVYIKDKFFSTTATTVFIVGSDTICAGNQITAYSGGTVERWLYSDGNKQNWQPIANSNGSPLVHKATSVSFSGWRYYRAIHSSITCVGDSSLLDSVYIRNYTGGYNQLIPTTSSNSICAGNSFIISLSVSPGVVQKWVYRDNSGPWKDFTGSSNLSISEFNSFVTATTVRDYKVIALKNCSFDTSAFVSVTLAPKTYGSDLTKVPTASSTSICSGDQVSGITISSITGSSVIQWMYRDNGDNWNFMTGSGVNSIIDNNTNVTSITTRDYIALITNATNCRIDTSAILSVTIKPLVRGNNNRVPIVPSTACTGNTFSYSLSVASDSMVYRWLYNLNGNGWIDRGYFNPLTNSTYNEYAYVGMNNISYRALVFKASACRLDTTLASTAILKQKVFGTDTTIVPTGLSPYCALSTTNIISLSSPNTVGGWLYSDNGGSWNLVNTNSLTLAGAINTQQTINRKYRALITKAASCGIDTSAEKNITINPPVYGKDTAQKINITLPKSICSGASVNITSTSTGGVINKWLYRDDNTTTWSVINATSATSINDNNSNIQLTRQYTYVLYKAITCRMDTTAIPDTAYFNTRIRGTDTSIKVTSPTLSICAGSQISLVATGVGSNAIVQWIYSENGGQTWSNLSTTTATSLIDNNTDLTTSVNRLYRVIVRKASSCNIDTSDMVSVGIRARVFGKDSSIVPNALNNSVCSGMMASVNASIGSGRTIQKWLTSVDGGAWTDFAITGSTVVNDYNTVVVAPTSKRYLAIVTSASCTLDSTAFVDVSISPTGYGYQNQIVPLAANPVVCSGTSVRMHATLPLGTKVIRWLYRDKDSDPWLSTINSTDTLIDSNTTTNVTITRRYRLVLLNASGCSIDSSAFGTATINPITFGNMATTVQATKNAVCSGTTIALSIVTPSGYLVEEWLRKTGNQAWTQFTSNKSNGVNDTNTTVSNSVTRQYRVRLRNTGGCNTDTSLSTTVQVNAILSGTNLTYTPYSPISSICSGTTVSISLFGVNGAIKNWYSRDTNIGAWTIINRTDNIIIDTATTVTSVKVREYRALLYDAANCRYDTTNVFKLTINPRLTTNATGIIPSSSKSVYCTGNEIVLNATGFMNNGKVQGWLYSDKNGPWNIIISSDSETIHHVTTTVTSLTSRRYRALVLTGCTIDTTAVLTVTIDVMPYKPIVLRKFGSDTLMCSEVATSYQWKFNTTNLSGGTTSFWVAKQNGNYTVEITNASGCKSISDAYVMQNVGLDDASIIEGISLYPNPTQDGKLKIEFIKSVQQQMHLEVLNALGEVVHQSNITTINGGVDLDLSNQSEGIYLLHFTMNGEGKVYRVVVRN